MSSLFGWEKNGGWRNWILGHIGTQQHNSRLPQSREERNRPFTLSHKVTGRSFPGMFLEQWSQKYSGAKSIQCTQVTHHREVWMLARSIWMQVQSIKVLSRKATFHGKTSANKSCIIKNLYMLAWYHHTGVQLWPGWQANCFGGYRRLPLVISGWKEGYTADTSGPEKRRVERDSRLICLQPVICKVLTLMIHFKLWWVQYRWGRHSNMHYHGWVLSKCLRSTPQAFHHF